jgi:peptidoglycan hydrolase CwlO-like protein
VHPLTKILVALVVLLAIIQTAATVVFVNRVDVTSEKVKRLEEDSKARAATITSLQSQLADAQGQIGTVRQQAQAEVAAAQQQVVTLQQQLADRSQRLAESGSEVALGVVERTRLTEALKAAQDTQGKQAEVITELRKFYDELTRKVADLNTANADLTNRLEVTERERRFLQEQNAELQNQSNRATAALKDAGVAVPSPTQAVGVGAGAPPINAVIREVRTIANVPYATVSAGKADKVIPGMQFTILDASGNFLGFLVIDTVEPNEALGRLTGPRVTDIRAGNDARTRL